MAYKLADGTLSTDYEVGDEFVAVVDEGIQVSKGDVVRLVNTDGSACPTFINLTQDGAVGCPWWYNLKRRVKQFTKSDLKDGMRVELRNDWERLFVVGHFVFSPHSVSFTTSFQDSEVNDDLTHFNQRELDIMKVTDRDGTVLFERKPENRKVTLELTDEQIESFKSQGVM